MTVDPYISSPCNTNCGCHAKWKKRLFGRQVSALNRCLGNFVQLCFLLRRCINVHSPEVNALLSLVLPHDMGLFLISKISETKQILIVEVLLKVPLKKLITGLELLVKKAKGMQNQLFHQLNY